MHPRPTFRAVDRAIVDCAHCPSHHRCWEGEVPAGTGLLAQRETPLESGAMLTVPPGPPGTVFVVVSGCLTLRETLVDGTRRTAGFRLPGELVGLESWARTGDPYEILATTASLVCRLTVPRRGHGKDNSDFLHRLLVKSATQIDQAMRTWVGLPATERVAAFVEDFLHRARIKGSSSESLRLPMTRADIGSYLGLAEETVVRALAQLRHGRRFEVHGKTVGRCRPCATSSETP